MFEVEGNQIIMTEGDFGISLPIELELENGETISSDNNLKLAIYTNINTVPIITKIYENIQGNTINFQLDKSESLLLKAGRYFYDLDWYAGETFLNNIMRHEKFIVCEKAGVVNEG